MAEYDGSIRIGTGIDTKEFKAGSKEIESEARRMAKSVSDSLGEGAKIALQKQTDAFVKQNQQYAAQEQKIKDLGVKLHELQRTQIETPVFKETSKELASAEKKLDSLYGRLRELKATGKENTAPYKQAIAQIDIYKEKVSELQNQLKELKYSGEAYQPADTSKVQQEIAAAEQKQMQMYTALQTAADSLTQKVETQAAKEERILDIKENSTVADQKMVELLERRNELAAKLREAEKAGVGVGYKEYDEAYIAWKNAADAVKEYRAELDKQTESGQAKEEARINAIQAKEEARRAKEVTAIQEQEAEEQRLSEIRENAVVGNQRIVETVERIKELEQEIADLKAAGITEGYEDYDSRIQELEQLRQEVSDYSNSVSEMKSSYVNLAESVKMAFNTMAKGLRDIPIAALKAGIKGIGTLITKTMVLPFKTFGNVAKKAISSIIPLLKRATSSMLGFGKSTKSANNPLQAGFKNILKYGLGIRSMYVLVNKLRTAIKEGFTNMANEVEGFKAKVDSLKGSTLTLKNSFAAAFRPLVEVAIPYIQMVVDAMSQLLDKVGQFIAAIMGQKTYTKAIKQTTAAIEDENKAQNKQLSGLDKLNNLSSGSGGSGDSGTSSQMFEENVPISNRFADIAQQFKDMWESADFTDLGKILGDKLKNALESIPWDSIQQTVAKVGKSFATLINGIVEVPGLALDIGKTIGEAINTGIGGINSFLDNTHWGSVGVFIGEALNGLVNAISWEDIGHFFAAKFNAIFETIGEAARKFNWINFGLELSNGFNTFISDFDWAENGARLGDLVKNALDAIITFLENTNWQELGNNVANFIGSIDWTGIMERLAEGIGDAIGGLAAFLWGLIEDAWNSVVEWWRDTAYENGQFTWEGLLDGIVEGVKNIGNWIYEHIFEPFIKGFKNAFGIHSPSTVMAEMGIYIMQGLLNGIKSLVSTVVGAIQDVWNGIKGIFNGFMTFLTGVFTGNWKKAWSGIVSVFEGVRNNIKAIINGILGLIESLANGVINGINFVIGALNGLSFDIPDWVPLIGGETFGFNIPELSQVSIPRLATGTVVPPNNEFLAVLGDNKREPEVVSPLSTIEQAVENAMRRNGGMGGGEITIKIPVEIDGNVLFELIKKLDLEQYNRTKRPSFQM